MKISRTCALAVCLLVASAAPMPLIAQTYTDLYNFDSTHGAYPEYPSLLAQGRDGNLYGTTSEGGTSGVGVVFKIAPLGTLAVLYSFDHVHGSYPFGGLTLGADGNFYGTTLQGGGLGCGGVGCGTVFKIAPSGKLTTIHTFTDGAAGDNPYPPPIQAINGNVYGTAGDAVYRITPLGSFTQLGTISGGSYAPLLQATDGNFYGTETDGGSFGEGAVFEMTRDGAVRVLYSFNGTEGSTPYAPVIEATDSNFYGTTISGGDYGVGTAFKLTPQGAVTVLHSFPDPDYLNDGLEPTSGLVQGTDGNFYGVAGGGGDNAGISFKITSAGVYSIINYFNSVTGANPSSNLIQHTDGDIYGETVLGGTANLGVLCSIDLGLAPFASLVGTWGKVGQAQGVLGQGLTGTNGVFFNGVPATFKVVSDTYLTAIVPQGANTGFVTITTPNGDLKSNTKFVVNP